ncbi:hypothetical protein BASA60_001440 [Batrachochytrium salamandrivorans]|nr:hypothetical protein BASA60_001440 [Batrachochytrium salamandrivorans]
MQFSTIVISAIAVIASVHGAAIPAMDTPASSPVELEARSYNDQDSNSENTLEKRSPITTFPSPGDRVFEVFSLLRSGHC